MARIQSGAEVRVKTPTPELDLGIVIIHSLTEYLYLLGEYYSFLYTLARMNEGEIDEFVAEMSLRSHTVIGEVVERRRREYYLKEI